MIQVDKPLPGADLQPIEEAQVSPELPEREAASTPEEDDPAIEETKEQPS